MTTQFWGPFHARSLRARLAWAVVVMLAFLYSPVHAEVIGYNSWQWNGFTRSSPPPAESKTSTPAISWDSVSSSTSSSSSSTSSPSLTLMAASLALSSPASVSASASLGGGSASLSGLVYFDENCDGKVDADDWAISGALVSLNLAGYNDPLLYLYTGSDGSYKFTDLPAGIYSITLSISDSQPGTNVIGKLYDAADKKVNTGVGTVGVDKFLDITLEAGYKGVDYNFCQLAYPASLISKRLLTGGDPGIHHPNVPIPEPGSLALLFAAGLATGVFMRLQLRTRQA